MAKVLLLIVLLHTSAMNMAYSQIIETDFVYVYPPTAIAHPVTELIKLHPNVLNSGTITFQHEQNNTTYLKLCRDNFDEHDNYFDTDSIWVFSYFKTLEFGNWIIFSINSGFGHGIDFVFHNFKTGFSTKLQMYYRDSASFNRIAYDVENDWFTALLVTFLDPEWGSTSGGCCKGRMHYIHIYQNVSHYISGMDFHECYPESYKQPMVLIPDSDRRVFKYDKWTREECLYDSTDYNLAFSFVKGKRQIHAKVSGHFYLDHTCQCE